MAVTMDGFGSFGRRLPVLAVSVGLVLLGLVLVSGLSAQRAAVAHPAMRGGASRVSALQRLESLPVAAQSVISTTVGSGEKAFAARRWDSGYRLSGGGVRAQVGPAGVSLRAGGGSVSMALTRVGRGRQVGAVGAASLSARGDRVVLGRGTLREWYVAGPLGVEQGFSLSRRPVGAGGRVVLEFSLAGSLSARQTRSGIQFLTHSGRVALRYGGLQALDASGRRLPAFLAVEGRRLLLGVADRRARYPLRIDPLIQQGELTPSDQNGEQFGWSVALSSDGNTALIGGPTNGGGAAWVFTRAGSVWSQQGAKLTPLAGGSKFGWSVALSSDGNTALIGSPNDRAAWVFTRVGTVWTQQAKLATADENCCGFLGLPLGASVALSSDGNTALIGAPGDNSESGAAWVFVRAGIVWSQQGGELTAPNGVALFGSSVALSADGNTALIGGPWDNGTGGAWVFTRAGSVWTQQAELTPSDELNVGNQETFGEGFGGSVALSSDGNTALIGAVGDNGENGAAWVFTRAGSVWSQQGAKLTPSDAQGSGGWFGSHVALSSDGNTALIDRPRDDVGAGAVWVFTRAGTVWTQQGTKLALSTHSLALSSSGDTALMGDGDGSHAWVFVNAPAGSGSGGGGSGYGGSGGSGAGSASRPSPTSPPVISGIAKASSLLRCSTGSWSGSPTSFAYQWYRDGTPIQGASSSSYRVQRSDEGLWITCSVRASNPAGRSGPSSSAGVLVAVPKVKGCPAATGTLHGATLGRVHLGMSRAAARHAFVKSSDRGKRYEDFFCLTPIGMRVGYASRKESRKLAGRVIWVSTSSAFYAVHRIRVGATVAAARTALKLTAPIRVGLNTWYFAANGKSNAIFKVRRGIIEEIGIAQKSLTGSARAQKAFLRSFR